ncbi:MAG: hypothetical protein IPL40_10535 [Proteobacteria bacterium]|nr:hypothetical protein [Pseudomonadota bacterium]
MPTWSSSARLRGATLVVALVALDGCVAINGGAIEARWTLRNAQGERLRCDDPAVTVDKVRLRLLPEPSGDDSCATADYCRFDCSDEVGVTPFVIPAGTYATGIELLAADGRALGPSAGVRTPALLLRQVAVGELTNLNVSLVLIER